MRNTSQRIKVLDIDSEQQSVKVKFLGSNIIMSLSKGLLERKIKEGFYKLEGGGI